MAGCNKSYADNFVTNRLSTRVLAPPGGGRSSVGGLIFGGAPPARSSNKSRENKENVEPEKKQMELERPRTLQTVGPLSDAEKVREFTFEAGQPVPEKPQLMDRKEVAFVTKMVIDELLELQATVMGPEAAKAAMLKMVDGAKSVPRLKVTPNRSYEVIGEQGDALVDIWYYSLNAMAKKGVNLSSIFDLVHSANMAKRDPATGRFEKRDDGKIVKPKGWRAPNVGQEIKRQQDQGSWTKTGGSNQQQQQHGQQQHHNHRQQRHGRF